MPGAPPRRPGVGDGRRGRWDLQCPRDSEIACGVKGARVRSREHRKPGLTCEERKRARGQGVPGSRSLDRGRPDALDTYVATLAGSRTAGVSMICLRPHALPPSTSRSVSTACARCRANSLVCTPLGSWPRSQAPQEAPTVLAGDYWITIRFHLQPDVIAVRPYRLHRELALNRRSPGRQAAAGAPRTSAQIPRQAVQASACSPGPPHGTYRARRGSSAGGTSPRTRRASLGHLGYPRKKSSRSRRTKRSACWRQHEACETVPALSLH